LEKQKPFLERGTEERERKEAIGCADAGEKEHLGGRKRKRKILVRNEKLH
jgi:hypothetical protein